MSDTRSLAHTKGNCKYHIVVVPGIAARFFMERKSEPQAKFSRKLCEWKRGNIIKAECCPDLVRMLPEIPPKTSVSGVMG